MTSKNLENVLKGLLHLEVYQIASLHCALWKNKQNYILYNII